MKTAIYSAYQIKSMYAKNTGPEVRKTKTGFNLINFIIISKEKNGYIRQKGYLLITQVRKSII